MIEATHLTKRYGDTVALDGIVHTEIARIEQVDMFRRAPEGIRFELFGFGIGSPEDESNIQTPRRRASSTNPSNW